MKRKSGSRKPGLRTLLSLVFGGLVLLTALVTLGIVGGASGDAAVGEAIEEGRQAQRVLTERVGAELRKVELAARLHDRLPLGSAEGSTLFSLVPGADMTEAPPGLSEGWSILGTAPIYRAPGSSMIARVDLAQLQATMAAFMQEGVTGVLLGEGRILTRTRSNGRVDEVSNDDLMAMFASPIPPGQVLEEAPTLNRITRDSDEPVFVSSEPLSTAGLDLRVGFATTPSTVGGALAQVLVASVVAGCIALLAIAAALVVAARVARTIGGVRDALGHIAALDLDAVEPLPSMPARELEDIRLALDRAVRSLRAFGLFVPKTLVQRLLDRGDGSLRLAEERDVTVLFTDIVGFTTLAAAMRPAEVTALLDRHFELVTAAVEAEGGTVDKYVGDGILAYWGAPEPTTDHAARALAAAAAIQAGHMADREAGRADFALRIGVHSGPVVAGTVGTAARLDYTIVGDTVNVASRLEQLGRDIDPDGGCCALVSGEAHARSGLMDGERLGFHPLRGRAGEVEVVRL